MHNVLECTQGSAGRSEQMVEILRGGGGALTADVALQTQRLTLDIVGLVAFSHDFCQAELTRRHAPSDPNLIIEDTAAGPLIPQPPKP